MYGDLETDGTETCVGLVKGTKDYLYLHVYYQGHLPTRRFLHVLYSLVTVPSLMTCNELVLFVQRWSSLSEIETAERWLGISPIGANNLCNTLPELQSMRIPTPPLLGIYEFYHV